MLRRHTPALPPLFPPNPTAAAAAAWALAMLLPAVAAAQILPCNPCAGVRVDDPAAAAAALAPAGLEPGGPLVVAWEAELDGSGSAAAAAAVRDAGGTPWVALVFRTPAPVPEHAVALEAELEQASRLAAEAVEGTWFQVQWRPDAGETDAEGYGFLLKRAAVAVSGARPGARVATRPLRADPETLEALYAEEVSAYLEAVAVTPAPPEALTATAERLARLDPGRPLVVDAVAWPQPPVLALAEAARRTVAGAGMTLFDATGVTLDAAALAPLVMLARDFSGDIAYDPYSSPTGGDGAWSFVRGEDLALRVIARSPETGGEPVDELALTFSDATLRDPARLDPAGGEPIPLAGARRSRDGLEVRVADPGPVAVLALERPSVAELLGPGGVAGVEEEVTVESERQMPVEEILRRLQAFEDAQARRIDNYTATNTTFLRFGSGAQGNFEATLEGAFFYSADAENDWAWQTFYVNGVRWRGKSIPEIPLIQPEKAAAAPLIITFDKTYRYRLKGTDQVDGRDCWEIDFAPIEGAGETGNLFRGTVWVDREVYARVRSRAVQLGLDGEVLSNEETLYYRPIDAAGATADWSAESFVLPLRVVSNQLWSLINAATQVERETLLSAVTVNDPRFAERQAVLMDSEVTMVRDTAGGLRYLVKDEETGERVVQEGFDNNQLFLAGGVFHDDALDYPLPLAGIDYFSFDFKGSGNQLNAFFAGALATVDIAEPRLFGSKFDVGLDAFAIAVPLADTLYRDGEEIESEEVEQRPARIAFKLGRPLGNFFKLGLEYRLAYFDYSSTSETAEGFVVPSDTLTQFVNLSGRYVRSGYSLRLEGTYARRSEWDFWGLPGSSEYDPDHQDYTKWSAVLEKSWYPRRFQRLGAEIDYFDGADLDRFSKYEFGFFGDTQVHGYQSSKVRAESGYAAHLSYGFELGETLRLDALGDVAWATDELSGLDSELLAGVGLAGTVIGPWQTIVNLDVGVPVAGPDDGFVVFLVFLKLFK